MSGGSHNYLHWRLPDELQRLEDDIKYMASRLKAIAGSGYAWIQAHDLQCAIEHARHEAERLAEVFKAVEWSDSGDWGEDSVVEAAKAYEEASGRN